MGGEFGEGGGGAAGFGGGVGVGDGGVEVGGGGDLGLAAEHALVELLERFPGFEDLFHSGVVEEGEELAWRELAIEQERVDVTA